jgi:hypothetical protein
MKLKEVSKSDIAGIVILLFMFFFIVDYFIRVKRNNIDLQENARYTIGKTGESYGSRTGSTIEYIYFVGEIKYRQTQSMKDGVNYQRGSYIVAFSTINPKNSRMLFDRPVFSDTITVPEQGWTKIPNFEANNN